MAKNTHTREQQAGRHSLLARLRALVVAPKSEVTVNASKVYGSLDYGVDVDNYTALKLNAYYAGVKLLADNIASLPKGLYTRGSNGKQPLPAKHHINWLLHHPNDYTNSFDFWHIIVTHMVDWGKAVAWIQRDAAGRPIALHQAAPGSAMATYVKGRRYWQIMLANQSVPDRPTAPVSDDDILCFALMSVDGIEGINPVVYGAGALNKAMAQEAFAADFYRRGGNIRAVMETDGSMGDERYNKFVEHFNYSSRNFETPLLEYGVKYKQLDSNPAVTALIPSETLSVQDICRLLCIPPHMLAELSHATFSNIEHQDIQFVKYTLRPLCKRLESEIERKLLGSGEVHADFNLQGLLRGDTASRSAYYHNAILDGYLSRNEVRELEGYPRVDGLDDYLYPTNMAVVGQTPDTTKDTDNA